jgi:hypothetical protein
LSHFSFLRFQIIKITPFIGVIFCFSCHSSSSTAQNANEISFQLNKEAKVVPLVEVVLDESQTPITSRAPNGLVNVGGYYGFQDAGSKCYYIFDSLSQLQKRICADRFFQFRGAPHSFGKSGDTLALFFNAGKSLGLFDWKTDSLLKKVDLQWQEDLNVNSRLPVNFNWDSKYIMIPSALYYSKENPDNRAILKQNALQSPFLVFDFSGDYLGDGGKTPKEYQEGSMPDRNGFYSIILSKDVILVNYYMLRYIETMDMGGNGEVKYFNMGDFLTKVPNINKDISTLKFDRIQGMAVDVSNFNGVVYFLISTDRRYLCKLDFKNFTYSTHPLSHGNHFLFPYVENGVVSIYSYYIKDNEEYKTISKYRID